jgi:hypothetical protein
VFVVAVAEHREAFLGSVSLVLFRYIEHLFGKSRTEEPMDSEPKRADLEAEAAQRLRRLSEEVRSRLLEIALIAGRSVGVAVGGSSDVKFVSERARVAANADAGAGDWLEITDIDGFEVCYGSIGGKPFAESPCGAPKTKPDIRL